MREEEIAEGVDVDLGTVVEITCMRDVLVLVVMMLMGMLMVICRVVERHDLLFCGDDGMEMIRSSVVRRKDKGLEVRGRRVRKRKMVKEEVLKNVAKEVGTLSLALDEKYSLKAVLFTGGNSLNGPTVPIYAL